MLSIDAATSHHLDHEHPSTLLWSGNPWQAIDHGVPCRGPEQSLHNHRAARLGPGPLLLPLSILTHRTRLWSNSLLLSTTFPELGNHWKCFAGET